ncbi:MAG TPA: NHLP bacteriocin export ABC transporter permease/ATPase subunit [Gammaproteobacteria bacterium]|nr:NHLP bacteriocin export ABC transporter permease/ATPase subunit [Gammaproteobacteria bacterium]
MPNMHDDEIVASAIDQLASIFNASYTKPIGEQKDVLWLACKLIGDAIGVKVVNPDNIPLHTTVHNVVMSVAHASQFQVRRVLLKGHWWENDNGPLLAFSQETHQPFVLIMNHSGKYNIIEPASGYSRPFEAEMAQSLDFYAYSFYRCLPDIALNLKELLVFALKNQWRDIFRLLLLQTCIGLLGLLIPVATGILLNTAVPLADVSLLQQWIIGLVAITLGMVAFNAAKILSMIRLRYKTNASTQAAIWARLVRLPVRFFRAYTPGDLALRASGIDTIQQELTDATLQTFLSGIFSVLTLGLMFYYSPLLAVVAIVMLLIFLSLMFFNARMQLKYQRPIAQLQGRLANLVLQFLTSISKLRVSHSEGRSFALWAEKFSNKNRLFFKSSLLEIQFNIVTGILSIIGLLSVFGLVGAGYVKISFGSFIAFNAAFGQFFAATIGFASILMTWISLIPLYERIKPILTTLPESEVSGLDPGPVTGKIALSSVNFRYYSEGPWVLEDISLAIEPGEMVALVGPTGSGKSTLFRLLLGFETPATGGVFYNDQDLSKLNIRLLREQIGVVLQNGMLFAGTIFENIAGTHPLTMEDAWEVAAQVGLAQDIETMSMGMHTLISEGGKTLSVGQRQRLMIARALARKPQMLFLDEATSALDNPTQAEVMRNLEALKITRIVAAHRLSTLVNADRIFVLQAGKIVQTGSYDALMREPGLFATLAQRQIIS